MSKYSLVSDLYLDHTHRDHGRELPDPPADLVDILAIFSFPTVQSKALIKSLKLEIVVNPSAE